MSLNVSSNFQEELIDLSRQLTWNNNHGWILLNKAFKLPLELVPLRLLPSQSTSLCLCSVFDLSSIKTGGKRHQTNWKMRGKTRQAWQKTVNGTTIQCWSGNAKKSYQYHPSQNDTIGTSPQTLVECLCSSPVLPSPILFFLYDAVHQLATYNVCIFFSLMWFDVIIMFCNLRNFDYPNIVYDDKTSL